MEYIDPCLVIVVVLLLVLAQVRSMRRELLAAYEDRGRIAAIAESAGVPLWVTLPKVWHVVNPTLIGAAGAPSIPQAPQQQAA